jgi:hypothetical protein
VNGCQNHHEWSWSPGPTCGIAPCLLVGSLSHIGILIPQFFKIFWPTLNSSKCNKSVLVSRLVSRYPPVISAASCRFIVLDKLPCQFDKRLLPRLKIIYWLIFQVKLTRVNVISLCPHHSQSRYWTGLFRAIFVGYLKFPFTSLDRTIRQANQMHDCLDHST